jgi:hypothetical protein
MIMDRDGAIRFTLGGSGSVAGSEDFTILSNGNVGIGTTNPQRELHVHASNYTDIQLTNDTTGTGSGDGSTISATDNDLYLNNKESGNLLLYTSNSEKMRITSAGRVGIGTTSPSQIFEVSTTDYGVGKFTGNTDNGTGYVGAVLEIESNSNSRGRGVCVGGFSLLLLTIDHTRCLSMSC